MWSSAILLKSLTLFAAKSSPTYAVPSLSSVPTGSQGITSVALKASQLFKCCLIQKNIHSAPIMYRILYIYKLIPATHPCPPTTAALLAVIGWSWENRSEHMQKAKGKPSCPLPGRG